MVEIERDGRMERERERGGGRVGVDSWRRKGGRGRFGGREKETKEHLEGWR